MNKRGFTLVELLATIAIIGILSVLAVAGVSRYVRGAHEEQNKQNRKTVSMAAEMYLQSNRKMYPKHIGEETIIPISQLKETKYLQEEIQNDEGQSCMEESFVRVFKLGKNDYSYTTYLYCGEEKAPEQLDIPKPAISNFKFEGGTRNPDGSFSDVKDAYFSFTIEGGTLDETPIGIYSYQYAVFVSTDADEGEEREVYNSGTIKGGSKENVTVESKKLSEYLDTAGVTEVRVEVTVFNDEGGRLDYSSTSSADKGTFQDQMPPTCGPITGQAENDNDWINKQSGTNRSITVGCEDNSGGTGCKRKNFTKTWPYNYQTQTGINYNLGTRWSYITIEDNAKEVNRTKCYTRVNVDLQAPEVTITIYKATASGGKGTKLVTKTVKDSTTVNATMPSGTVKADQYSDLVEGWMNKEKYPNGIIIDVTAKDNLYLDSYTWETNNANLSAGTSEANIKKSLSAANGQTEQNGGTSYHRNLSDGLLDNVTNDEELARAEHGTLNTTVHGLKLSREGMRVGRLIVCDKAKNCTTVYVYANIDRTAPTISSVAYINTISRSDYTPATENDYQDTTKWTKENVEGTLNGSADTVSGWDHYDYEVLTKKTATATTWANGNYEKGTTNTFKVLEDGIYKIGLTSCDKAGNCYTRPDYDYIKIDKTAPTCGAATNATTTWINTDRTVKQACSDSLSQCVKNSYNTTYTTSTKNASVEIFDNAGNKTTCNYNVYVDKTAPTCGSITGASTTWTNKNRTISVACGDGTNQSGCSKESFSTTFSTTTKTSKITITDIAGNSKDCPVNVYVDKTAPTCGTVTGASTTWTKNDRSISVACADGTNQSGCSNTSFSQSFTNTAKTGTITIKDQAGNTASCPVNVYVDKTAPVCGTATGASTTWTKEDRTIDLACTDANSGCSAASVSKTFTATTKTAKMTLTDKVGNTTDCPVNVYVDKTAPSCTISGTNTTWTKNAVTIKRTCSDSHSGCDESYSGDSNKFTTTTKVGTLTAYTVKDKVGNTKVCPTTADVYVDVTPPTCTIGGASTTWTKNNRTITRTCSDTESGCSTSTPGDSTTFSSTTKVGTLAAYTMQDNVGNTRACGTSANVYVDKTAPSCTISGTNTTWTKNAVTIKRTCSDSHSGCDTSASGDSTKFTTTTKVGTLAAYTVKDKVGNTKVCPTTADVYIDVTPPTCTIGGASTTWTKNNRTITRTCSDTESGCSTSTPGDSTTFSATTKVGTLAAYTMQDKVGNTRACGTSANVYVDKTAPTCTHSGDSTTWTNSNRTIEFDCSDADSGCHSSSDTGSVTYTATKKTDVIDSYYIKDKAGNEVTCPQRTANIYIDKTPPTCTIGGASTSWTKNNRTITRTCSDNESGCNSSYSGDSKTYSSTTKTATLSAYTVKDNAGNTTACGTSVNVYVDKCDGTINYTTTSCSAKCNGGTKTKTGKSALSGLTCSTQTLNCNTQTCCSSVYYKASGSCSPSCAENQTGSQSYLAYSSYNDSRCSSKDTTVSCTVPKCFTKTTAEELCALNDDSLFGTAKGSLSGNFGAKVTNVGGSGWGNWCYADGTSCNPTTAYHRKCVTNLCKTYGVYGLTAEEINVKTWNTGYHLGEYGNKDYLNCFARYWCSCSGAF